MEAGSFHCLSQLQVCPTIEGIGWSDTIFRGVNDKVLQHIKEAWRLSSEPMHDILEIVPIKYLISGPFQYASFNVCTKLIQYTANTSRVLMRG
jgi:hypothetical protein